MQVFLLYRLLDLAITNTHASAPPISLNNQLTNNVARAALNFYNLSAKMVSVESTFLSLNFLAPYNFKVTMFSPADALRSFTPDHT